MDATVGRVIGGLADEERASRIKSRCRVRCWPGGRFQLVSPRTRAAVLRCVGAVRPPDARYERLPGRISRLLVCFPARFFIWRFAGSDCTDLLLPLPARKFTGACPRSGHNIFAYQLFGPFSSGLMLPGAAAAQIQEISCGCHHVAMSNACGNLAGVARLAVVMMLAPFDGREDQLHRLRQNSARRNLMAIQRRSRELHFAG